MTDVTNSPNFYVGRSADVGDMLLHRQIVKDGSHDLRSLQLSKSCISLQLFEITNGRQKDELNQA